MTSRSLIFKKRISTSYVIQKGGRPDFKQEEIARHTVSKFKTMHKQLPIFLPC